MANKSKPDNSTSNFVDAKDTLSDSTITETYAENVLDSNTNSPSPNNNSSTLNSKSPTSNSSEKSVTSSALKRQAEYSTATDESSARKRPARRARNNQPSSFHDSSSSSSSSTSASSSEFSDDNDSNLTQTQKLTSSPHHTTTADDDSNTPCKDDSLDNSAEMKDLKQMFIKEKVAALTCEIDAVENGTHPELTQRLDAIETHFRSRLAVADLRKRYENSSAYEMFMCCINGADQDYQAGMREIQRYYLSKVENMLLIDYSKLPLSREELVMIKESREIFMHELKKSGTSTEPEYFLVCKEKLTDEQIEHDLKLITRHVK